MLFDSLVKSDPKHAPGWIAAACLEGHAGRMVAARIKRARMLFDSLVKSDPKHAPGWIAAACLEEHAGRMVATRKIIKMGCEQCPKSKDVWLEAARLHVCIHLCPKLLTSMLIICYFRVTKMRK